MGLASLVDHVRAIPLSVFLIGAFVSWLLYIVGLAVSRLYLSPLAKFPGPKLAAFTKWYEFYYEVVLRGQYQFLINDMHKKYGTSPIWRYCEKPALPDSRATRSDYTAWITDPAAVLAKARPD